MPLENIIKFTCPDCQTNLTVPAELAGVTGPCPSCGEFITAPRQPARQPDLSREPSPTPQPEQRPAREPEPERLTQTPDSDRAQQRATGPLPSFEPPQSSWKSAIIPIILLTLIAAVILIILSVIGVFGSNEEEPAPPAQTPRTTLTDPLKIDQLEPVEKPRPEEVALSGIQTSTPDPVRSAPQPNQENIDPKAQLLLQARKTLAAFFQASDFESRKKHLSQSQRSNLQLSQTILASAFPNHTSPVLEKTRMFEDSFHAFFSVGFEDDYGQITQITPIQTTSVSHTGNTKILTDPFVDFFERKLNKLAEKPSAAIQTLACILQYSSYCFDDIPESDKMAKLAFYPNFASAASSIASAYLQRDSDTFTQIRNLGESDERLAATLSLKWDYETNPEQPYLKVLRLDSPSWISAE